MSYKITNTFITHLTEKAVNTISVKRFSVKAGICIFLFLSLRLELTTQRVYSYDPTQEGI